MSPTQRSYLISFVAGAVLAGMVPVLDLLATGQSIQAWQPLAAAFAGGIVLFLRDWARNNSNARLEKPDAQAGIPTAAATSSTLIPAYLDVLHSHPPQGGSG